MERHHAPEARRVGFAEAGLGVLTELDVILNARVDCAADAEASAKAGQDKILRYRRLEPLPMPSMLAEVARMLTELRTSPPAA